MRDLMACDIGLFWGFLASFVYVWACFVDVWASFVDVWASFVDIQTFFVDVSSEGSSCV